MYQNGSEWQVVHEFHACADLLLDRAAFLQAQDVLGALELLVRVD